MSLGLAMEHRSATPALPPLAARQLAQLPSLDPSSRANSMESGVSHGTQASAASEQAGGQPSCLQGAASAELDAGATSAVTLGLPPGLQLAPGSPAEALQPGGATAMPQDAKSSALKALAGVSAIVSKSRKVDAEALQTIKMQRAKARAEGQAPATATAAMTSTAALAGGAGSTGAPTPPGGRGTPPPPVGSEGPGISPFAAVSSQGLGRSPSGSNLSASHSHGSHSREHSNHSSHSGREHSSQAQGGSTGLSQAVSLPMSTHSHAHSHLQSHQRAAALRRSPSGTPPTDFESMVSKLGTTELLALRQAVDGQLARHARALAQLQQTSSSQAAQQAQQVQQAQQAQQAQQVQQAQHAQQADALSQQYAALLLQGAQQAQQQLVQQQQQAAAAAAIQQALAAAAAASHQQAGIGVGVPSPAFTPEQLLLAGTVASSSGTGSMATTGGAATLGRYSSMPLPGDMASSAARAPYPTDPNFALPFNPEAALLSRGNSLGMPTPPQLRPQPQLQAAGHPPHSGGNVGAASGSPRSAFAEQHLIGEALHLFLDPEMQGPPSMQDSPLLRGITWGDRRSSAALPPTPASSTAAAATAAGAAASQSQEQLPFPRSRSLPPQEVLGLLPDRSASLNDYLAEEQLPSLFGGLHMAEPLQHQQHQTEAGAAPPTSAFAAPALASRSGSLHAPLGAQQLAPAAAPFGQGQPHVSFSDTLHMHHPF